MCFRKTECFLFFCKEGFGRPYGKTPNLLRWWKKCFPPRRFHDIIRRVRATTNRFDWLIGKERQARLSCPKGFPLAIFWKDER